MMATNAPALMPDSGLGTAFGKTTVGELVVQAKEAVMQGQRQPEGTGHVRTPAIPQPVT